jgi:hypothetical protein
LFFSFSATRIFFFSNKNFFCSLFFFLFFFQQQHNDKQERWDKLILKSIEYSVQPQAQIWVKKIQMAAGMIGNDRGSKQYGDKERDKNSKL